MTEGVLVSKFLFEKLKLKQNKNLKLNMYYFPFSYKIQMSEGSTPVRPLETRRLPVLADVTSWRETDWRPTNIWRKWSTIGNWSGAVLGSVISSELNWSTTRNLGQTLRILLLRVLQIQAFTTRSMWKENPSGHPWRRHWQRPPQANPRQQIPPSSPSYCGTHS